MKQVAPGAPHECVVASWDPSNKCTGFAIFVDGKLELTRGLETGRELHDTASEAVEFAATLKRRLVHVVEDWGGSNHTWQTAYGMGAARGHVEQAIVVSGYRLDHIVWINLSTWRKRAGVGWCGDTDAYKARAVEMVKRKFRVDVGHDEAEATLLGDVASRSPEVGEMLVTIGRARKKAA